MLHSSSLLSLLSSVSLSKPEPDTGAAALHTCTRVCSEGHRALENTHRCSVRECPNWSARECARERFWSIFCMEEHVCGVKQASVRMRGGQVLLWSTEFSVYYRRAFCLPLLSLPFGYLLRAKSILLGCPPRLVQQTGAKGTLVSDFFMSSSPLGVVMCVCVFQCVK